MKSAVRSIARFFVTNAARHSSVAHATPGLPAWQLLGLPWPRYFIPFDITGNVLAYAPLGTRGTPDETAAAPTGRPNVTPGAPGAPDLNGVAQRTQDQLRARQAARAAARTRAGLNTVAP